MAATTYGKGVFDLKQETGMITHSVNFDFSTKKVELADNTGATVGVAHYDERAEVSISAKVSDTTPFSANVATALTLINEIPAHITDPTSGTVIIDTISVSKDKEDYEGLELKATYYPAIAAA